MNKKMSRFAPLLLGVALIMGLAGCGKEKEIDTTDEKVFSFHGEKVCLDEVWIYAQTVKESYEKKYGEQVWSIETKNENNEPATMETITRKDIIEDIVMTKALVAKSEAYGVSLTDEQKTEADTQAQSFYNGLTDEQLKESGISLDTAKRVYEENMLADQVYQVALQEGNIEVSDEAARMTTIYDLYFACFSEDDAGNIVEFSDERKNTQKANAQEAMQSLDDPENPVDFDTIYARYGMKYGGKRTMTKADLVNEYGEELTDVLYALENGTHTDVVQTEYGYHIIQMIALTDEETTAARKADMLEKKQKEYMDTLYMKWIEELDKNWTYSDVDQGVYALIPFQVLETE